jgi:hypothetical protein
MYIAINIISTSSYPKIRAIQVLDNEMLLISLGFHVII